MGYGRTQHDRSHAGLHGSTPLRHRRFSNSVYRQPPGAKVAGTIDRGDFGAHEAQRGVTHDQLPFPAALAVALVRRRPLRTPACRGARVHIGMGGREQGVQTKTRPRERPVCAAASCTYNTYRQVRHFQNGIRRVSWKRILSIVPCKQRPHIWPVLSTAFDFGVGLGLCAIVFRAGVTCAGPGVGMVRV